MDSRIPTKPNEFHAISVGHIAAERELLVMLTKFCDFLQRMEFDKAREIVETERSRITCAVMPSSLKAWQSMLSAMLQLAVAESLYYSLSFFLSKFSFRKENHIRDTYIQLKSEFQRHFDATSEIFPTSPSSANQVQPNSQKLCSLLSELIKLACLRIELISFYIALPGRDWKNVATECLDKIAQVADICEEKDRSCQQEQFNVLYSSAKEVAVLRMLFSTQQSISGCDMVGSLIKLKELSVTFNEWSSLFDSVTLTTRPSTSFILSFTKKAKTTATSKLALVHFLHQFYQTLLAKFSLYFHDVLAPFSPHNEMKAAFTNNSFLHQFQSFAKKNPQIICIIANRIELDTPFYGFGYHKPSMQSKFSSAEYWKPANSGINEKYPPLFVYPPDRKLFDTIYANITSFVQDVWLSQTTTVIDGKIKYLYDKKKEQTFFTACIEQNIHLVVVYDRKIQEKDGPVVSFFNDTLASLRLVRLFQDDLRNSSKS